MDQSSQIPYTDVLSVQSTDQLNDFDQQKNNSDHLQVSDDTLSDRSGRVHPTVDIAEILRRWTHALQRIHKHSLLLVFCFLQCIKLFFLSL